MGVLAPGSVHARHSNQTPINTEEFFQFILWGLEYTQICIALVQPLIGKMQFFVYHYPFSQTFYFVHTQLKTLGSFSFWFGWNFELSIHTQKFAGILYFFLFHSMKNNLMFMP